MRAVSSVGWLVLSLLRRMLREGTVLRSLLTPGLIASVGTLATVGVLSFVQAPDKIAVAGPVWDALAERAERDRVELVEVADVEAGIARRDVRVITDGKSLTIDLTGLPPLRAEQTARRALQGAWRPWVRSKRHQAREANPRFNIVMLQLIGFLFCLYAVVFSAGGIAKDRTEGLLDVQLSLPLPFWWIGAARWLASMALLGGVWISTVALLAASLYVPDPVAIGLHGLCGIATSTAIGMITVGRASLDRGFAGPLSAGLVITGVLVSLPIAGLGISAWLPISSLLPLQGGAPLAVVATLAGAASAGGVLSFAMITAVQR